MITCPHCDHETNEAGSAFCESCGKALPSGKKKGPKVVTGDKIAKSKAGQNLQNKQLQKTLKSASGGLLAVAVIQLLFGAFLVWSTSQLYQKEGLEMPLMVPITMFGIAAAFFGLWFWSRKSPFPASVAGLLLYISLHALEAITDPTTIFQGILMKIVIIIILGKGIKAGLTYNKLKKTKAT